MASYASRRRSTASCNKSRSRIIIPDHSSLSVDKVIQERSNQLIDIGLADGALTIYQMNALYDFSYDELRSYQRELGKRLVEEVFEAPNTPYTTLNVPDVFIVEMKHFPNMAYNERDHPSIKITIVAENEGGSRHVVFEGFLLSIEREEGCLEKERLDAGAIILPLFLVRYEHDCFDTSVRKFFEEKFSSVITSLKLSSEELIFMLFLFSSPGNDKNTSTVISYKGPSKDFSSIEYAIENSTVSEIWKKVAANCPDIVTVSDTYEFISVFEEHFFKHFSINLKHFELDTIRTPLAVVNADEYGIKVSKSPKLFYVLRHLTHLAQE